MLSPKKLQRYKADKLLPTINILDVVSLHSWIDLRKLTIDYGRKYFFRHEIFMPVVFLISITCLVSIFVILADFIPFGNSESTKTELKKMLVGLSGAAAYFLTLFFSLLYSAALINEQFDIHKEILQNNKDLLQDISMFKEFYFAKELNPELIPNAEEIQLMNYVTKEFASVKSFKSLDSPETALTPQGGAMELIEFSTNDESEEKVPLKSPNEAMENSKILTYDVKSLLSIAELPGKLQNL
jgi:hypothetical protein